jgi:hypothetical protein
LKIETARFVGILESDDKLTDREISVKQKCLLQFSPMIRLPFAINLYVNILTKRNGLERGVGKTNIKQVVKEQSSENHIDRNKCAGLAMSCLEALLSWDAQGVVAKINPLSVKTGMQLHPDIGL